MCWSCCIKIISLTKTAVTNITELHLMQMAPSSVIMVASPTIGGKTQSIKRQVILGYKQNKYSHQNWLWIVSPLPLIQVPKECWSYFTSGSYFLCAESLLWRKLGWISGRGKGPSCTASILGLGPIGSGRAKNSKLHHTGPCMAMTMSLFGRPTCWVGTD